MRRSFSCILDSQKILTQHHPSLHFLGTSILTLSKIYHRTFLPVMVPVILGGIRHFTESFTSRRCLLGILASQLQVGRLRLQLIEVLSLLLEFCRTLPSQHHKIDGFIDDSLQNCRTFILRYEHCGMKIIFIPIASIVSMTACWISKADIYGDVSLRLHMSGNHIKRWVTSRLHPVCFTFIYKATPNHTIPHIQGLIHLLDVFWIRTKRQTQCTQMKAMRIHTKPVTSSLLSLVILNLSSIRLFSPTSEIIITPTFFRLVILRISKRMPSPITHCSKRYTLGI